MGTQTAFDERSVFFGGQLYAALADGGFTGSTAAYLLRRESGNWTTLELPPMEIPQCGTSVRLPSGEILVAGGLYLSPEPHPETGTISTVEAYRPGAPHWSARPAMLSGLWGQSMLALRDGTVVVFGGISDFDPYGPPGSVGSVEILPGGGSSWIDGGWFDLEFDGDPHQGAREVNGRVRTGAYDLRAKGWVPIQYDVATRTAERGPLLRHAHTWGTFYSGQRMLVLLTWGTRMEVDVFDWARARWRRYFDDAGFEWAGFAPLSDHTALLFRKPSNGIGSLPTGIAAVEEINLDTGARRAVPQPVHANDVERVISLPGGRVVIVDLESAAAYGASFVHCD